MTDIERLIEVLAYANDTHQDWRGLFESPEEALDIINGTLEEEPSEHEIAYIISAVEEEDFFSSSLKRSFRKCILGLRKQLEEGLSRA